nr:nesprin-4 isoform X4 [Manis javanica]
MALPPPLGPRLNSEPLNHPPGAPRELDTVGCPNCPVSGEERIRLPTPSSHEDPAGGKHYEVLRLGSTGKDSRWGQSWYRPRDGLCCREASRRQELAEEHPISGREVLEADQDSLYLCLMGLGLWLQDLEQSLACWASAQSGMIQLQVFEEATTLDQDLEVEGDSDGPGPGGVWGPWTPSSLPTPAELEWDPAGDVGGFGPLGRKTAWTPGAPCELCGHRDPQGRGQGLEVRAGHAHVRPQPPEALSGSPKTLLAPEVSGQEANISQSPRCVAGGRPWNPCSCIQVAPQLPPPPPPPLPYPGGCHSAPAPIRGLLLLSHQTDQDTLPGAQLCQWPPSSMTTQPRHM